MAATKHEFEVLQLVRHSQDVRKVLVFADHDLRERVIELVAQEVAAVGGVELHPDRAEFSRSDPRGDLVDVVVEHGGDRLSGLDTEVYQSMGEAGRERVELAVRVGVSVKVEEDLIRCSGNGPLQRMQDGVRGTNFTLGQLTAHRRAAS